MRSKHPEGPELYVTPKDSRHAVAYCLPYLLQSHSKTKAGPSETALVKRDNLCFDSVGGFTLPK